MKVSVRVVPSCVEFPDDLSGVWEDVDPVMLTDQDGRSVAEPKSDHTEEGLDWMKTGFCHWVL